MSTDDDRLSEAEIEALESVETWTIRHNLVGRWRRDLTKEGAAAVERIVAERVREAERRGAVEALRNAARDLPVWEGVNEVQVYNWLAARAARMEYADRLDRDGGA